MGTIAPSGDQDSAFDNESSDFVPLTPEQVQAVKAANPATSPWWVVAGQVLVGVLVSGLAWFFFGEWVAKSVVCGVLAVVVPAALFARGLTSQFATANTGAAVMSFFVWELVKIIVTVGIMFAAHRLVTGLSWPAMLVGLIVTIKVYWLALAFKRRAKSVQVINALRQK